MSEVLAHLQERVSALVVPLHEELSTIELELEKTKQRREELLAARHKVRSMLRSLDPSYAASERRNGTRPGPKTNASAGRNRGTPNTSGVTGERRLQMVVEWMQHRAEEINQEPGFYATAICKRPDWPFGGQSPTNKTFKELHRRGAIRLVSANGPGGANYFKVVVPEKSNG